MYLETPKERCPTLAEHEVREIGVAAFDARFPCLSIDWNGEGGSLGLCEREFLRTLVPKYLKDRPRVDELWLLVTAGDSFAEMVGIDGPSPAKLNGFGEVASVLEGGLYDRVFLHQWPLARLLGWTASTRWSLLKDRPR